MTIQLIEKPITASEFCALWHAAGKKCQLCAKALTLMNAHVDLNRITGSIRGILCGSCEKGIECFGDLDLAAKAVVYLAHLR